MASSAAMQQSSYGPKPNERMAPAEAEIHLAPAHKKSRCPVQTDVSGEIASEQIAVQPALQLTPVGVGTLLYHIAMDSFQVTQWCPCLQLPLVLLGYSIGTYLVRCHGCRDRSKTGFSSTPPPPLAQSCIPVSIQVRTRLIGDGSYSVQLWVRCFHVFRSQAGEEVPVKKHG